MKEKLFTRNFTLLLVGQASSLLGNNTLKFALSMFVLEETGSATVFATILALAMAPTILLSPLGGILADRANRKSIMVALDSLSGLAVLMACLLLSLGDRVLVVGALLVVLSILGAFESPTVQACVPQMLSGERLLQGNAAVSQIQAAASLVTPFLGSVLYTALGIQPIFLGAVACFFLTALLECFLQLDYRRPSRQAGVGAALRKDLSESMEFLIRQEPGICKLLLLAALVSLFVSGAMVVGFPYLVRTVLDLSAALYGIAESALGVAAVLGGVCVGLLGGAPPPGTAGRGVFRVWPVPAPLRAGLPAALGRPGAVWGAAGIFLHLPGGVQRLLHLCHLRHPGPDAGAPDGKGHVLCVHPVPVRPAPGPAAVRRPVRHLLAGPLVCAAAHRAGGMGRRPAVPAILPQAGTPMGAARPCAKSPTQGQGILKRRAHRMKLVN